MPFMWAHALIVLSALLHAGWNALIKRQRDHTAAATAVLGLSAVATLMLWPFTVDVAFPTGLSLFWAVAAGLCEAGYFITLGLALRDATLGLAYAVVRGGAMLVVWPVSVLLLHEHIAWGAALGAAVLAMGLVCMNREASVSGRKQAPQRLRAAYLAALCVAGYHLCYDRALAQGAQYIALFAVGVTVATPLNLLWMRRGAWSRVRASYRASRWQVLLAGVTCTLSFLIFLSALHQAGAGVGLTLRNTSVLFAQGYAWALGERPRRVQWLGAALVCIGAICVGLAH